MTLRQATHILRNIDASSDDVCYLPTNAKVVYENGANVNTGFVTNLLSDRAAADRAAGVCISLSPSERAIIDRLNGKQ